MELRELDLTISREHDHPDIDTTQRYLCMIGGTYWVGKFERSFRGLIFHGWHDNAILYDRPGTNNSHWNKIYQIVESSKESYDRIVAKSNQDKSWTPRDKKIVRNSNGNIILKYQHR